MLRIILTCTLFAAVGLACSGTPEKPSHSGHLTRSQAKQLFPQTLGSFALAQYKVHQKSEAWSEYKAEYMRGSQILKLVINDHLPAGNPAWADKLASGTDTVSGHTALLEVKGRKITLMVRPHERFRVDFKSRNMNADQLREIADKYDLGPLAQLAQP